MSDLNRSIANGKGNALGSLESRPFSVFPKSFDFISISRPVSSTEDINAIL
jgi:hypothetical protein